MTEIRLHNSRTRRKEPFAPIDAENVRMYVCGPTVYDRAHLGNARPVVVFDVLYRLLRHVYGDAHVTYVRNFTDVDDKINARARAMQEAGDARTLNDIIRALTDETIDWYHADMDALGALRPDHAPRATDYIEQMKQMIQLLIDNGNAYVVRSPSNNPPEEYVIFDKSTYTGEHTLFEVDTFEKYGALSGRSVEDMIAGARGEKAPNKRHPADFVLWKPSADDEPGWDSPWGRGRPGWHIECSAMSHELLGPAFDIHGGGIDLQFPHHENEIAQSCCAHPEADFANVWLHNEMVQVEGKKMSKSLGNFFTVRDLLDQGWPGEVIRFVMLSTHYRKPMDWTEEKARIAKKHLTNWYQLVSGVSYYEGHLGRQPDIADVWGIDKAVGDDLNTAKAINILHHLAERAKQSGRQQDKRELLVAANFLGLLLDDPARWADKPSEDLTVYSDRLIELRREAKVTKDFSAADGFREMLVSAGVEVRIAGAGIELIAGPDFDPAKLEALK